MATSEASSALPNKPENYAANLLENESSSELAVAGEVAAYGKSFVLPKNVSFGIELQFSKDAGSVNVQVDLEQSNTLPTTEGAVDTGWAVGDAISTGITDTNTHIIEVAPVVTRFARLKLTGLTGNDASVALSKAKLCISPNR